MFDRYDIVSERDIREAAWKLESYVSESQKAADKDDWKGTSGHSQRALSVSGGAKLLNYLVRRGGT